ncbi:iron ABC transporter substrate-binding protein [Cupriavidus gilardii CR3]|uniref:Siderophore ABC transporter substrate-binding protein n=1 Tax=Cupriavidus gilardii TaxID=82541 RepID=A0A849BEZ2_9BURK|nr:siderophore ABC transporter substrate-binding protein [Cupriavidus gilardii]ALD93365.1 iron ABC transporter substrate-binding protein [Cupriavidus gilardii CR3]KAB0599244.1 siderophore ABC transporter substrate-binding protein [Cupriavidus gilardii]MCT9013304.1 siderophore ABC transporter substrate-binding protein [Cupriavidus gilardii]MCT9052858.1 siderophore ABC transporter substrate-binding protein [Cupriavidus gilardii]NNH12383.1 siderophore ABC transporter substrate-binding protein [Cu
MQSISFNMSAAFAALSICAACSAFAAAPTATSTATGHALSIAHAKGTTTLAAPPAKVVTMDLSTLDTLDALGVPVAGVPATKLPAHLVRYQDDSVVKVGTLFEPNQAVIEAIAPGLIVVGGRSARQYEALSRLAPTVDLSIDRGDRIGSIARHADSLGRVFGRQQQAGSAVQALRASVEALKQKAATAGTALVVLIAGEHISAQGPGSRFGTVHDAFGFQAALPGLNPEGKGTKLTVQQVREANPDWLFVIDRDAAVGKPPSAALASIDGAALGRNAAGKPVRVVKLDPVLWYLMDGGGVRGMQLTVQQISDVLRDAVPPPTSVVPAHAGTQ